MLTLCFLLFSVGRMFNITLNSPENSYKCCYLCIAQVRLSIIMPDCNSKGHGSCETPLLVSETPFSLPPTRGSHAAGRLRIVGLITRGQVLDSCPPAVLFHPIRNSICWPTQLLSGTPPTHTGGALCASVCVFPFVAGVRRCERPGER